MKTQVHHSPGRITAKIRVEGAEFGRSDFLDALYDAALLQGVDLLQGAKIQYDPILGLVTLHAPPQG